MVSPCCECIVEDAVELVSPVVLGGTENTSASCLAPRYNHSLNDGNTSTCYTLPTFSVQHFLFSQHQPAFFNALVRIDLNSSLPCAVVFHVSVTLSGTRCGEGRRVPCHVISPTNQQRGCVLKCACADAAGGCASTDEWYLRLATVHAPAQICEVDILVIDAVDAWKHNGNTGLYDDVVPAY